MTNLTEQQKQLILAFLKNNAGKNPLVKEVLKKE
jgi:hypothetical protein